ncbi:HAD family phosphatase [Pseudobacter ginsenosidimutans]|nr:HAD family phosphatase [Pseudobacter ginsenosidimutans]
MSTLIEDKLAILTKLSEGDFEAFLYDCDGTLADNMGAHKASYKAVAANYGIDLDVSIIDELAGWPIPAVSEEIRKRYKTDFDPAVFTQQKNAQFEESFINETRPVEFVVEHLKAHAGKFRIGVVSGSERNAVVKTMQILGIESLVEVMVCAGETPHGKPFADPFLEAAKLLNVQPDKCLVFEDGDAGIKAAEAAGMKWIRIDRV